MATTTNYGWTTPDDTGLVKDGASAIRSLGNSIDTTTKNLNPQTTTGAIAYRSATANVNTSLPLGTAGQVLKVNAGATAPEWGTATGTSLQEVIFNASNASWTIPTGVTQIWALVVGGGGGGGASSTASANNSSGAGGAGQVKEQLFTVSGDTTLNITVGGGGAGATTQGAKGSTGSASTIVGNTSATTYVTAAGGGGGAGGAAANVAGLTGASSGGDGNSTTNAAGGGGGGFSESASDGQYSFYTGASITFGSGTSAPTTYAITGSRGGSASGPQVSYGGKGIIMWNRALAGGGNGPGMSTPSLSSNFGAANSVANNVAGGNATANTGAGGGGASTSTSTQRNGGNGGSGLVVLRYVA